LKLTKPFICVGLAAVLCSCVPPRNLPDPRPAFAPAEGKRQAVELKTFDVMARSNKVHENRVVESPSLRSGNKWVGFRSQLFDSDESCAIFVDGHAVASAKVFYVEPKKGTAAALRVDKSAGTITSSLVSSADVGYSYTLRPLGDGRIAFDWEATQAGFHFCFFINGTYYRNAGVTADGVPVPLLPLESLSAGQALLKELKGPTRIEVAPGKPLESIAVDVGTGYSVSLMENKGKDASLWIWVHSSGTKGSFTLDLGVTAVSEVAAPPAIAGVDFWASDRSHVPAPVTRNLMPNPGFEQGLRYWRWWYGGGKYVPSDKPEYSISSDAKFGARSLLIQNEGGGMAIMSFPLPVLKGHDYTVSFHAKAAQAGASLCLGVQTALRNDGSKMGWQEGFKYRHRLSTDWKRYSFTFTSDTAAVTLLLAPANCPVWVDGVQVEEAAAPTDYVGPEVEGRLLTADPDNMLALGGKLDARFELSGQPGLKGELDLTLFDFYREKQFQKKIPFTLGPDGLVTLPLPLDAKALGTGIFVLRADYAMAGKAVSTDYFRFSIMDFLDNTHATKNVFGTLIRLRHARGADYARNCMRWGFGGNSYNPDPRLEQDYRIRDFCETIYSRLTPEQHDDYYAAIEKWTEFTPERIKRIEDICADVVKRNPEVTIWAPTCEQEGRTPLVIAGNFDEWAKFQAAAFRGIKRANPKAIVLPDTGTSGLSRLRGFREQEGYLRATQKLARWDAMAAHPYGSLDNTCGNGDLDATTAQFIELMARYGYGPETPIYYTEGFNVTDSNIPEWGSGGAYDNYGVGRPTYDTGWREFLHAAWVARTYLVCLKYWPQVQTFNIWVSAPDIDLDFAPLFVCKVPNTLGHLLPNPTFKADFRPVGGVRGYAFEDGQGNGLVAVWCTMDKVDNGLDRGPDLLARFGGDLPDFIDLMGNIRHPETKAGTTAIQLSSAPLFLRCPAAGLDRLLKALNAAQIVGAGSALTLDVQPRPDGQLEAVLFNQTGAALAGKLAVGGSSQTFDIPAKSKAVVPVPGGAGAAPGKLDTWRKSLAVEFANGKREELLWDLAYFYVPRAAQPLPIDPAAPGWDKIPAISLTNWFIQKTAVGAALGKRSGSQDLDVKFQLAWDPDNLYLRVSGADDQYVLSAPARWRDSQLYMHDGSLEVYFDTGANGRSNPGRGYDLDDYRYDCYAGDARAADGPGSVHRLREAYHQLAGGLNMPAKDEAARGVKCQYRRDGGTWTYVIVFPQRYIEPLKLEQGWRAGFGLYVHDKAPGEEWPAKGLSLATEPGSHCDHNPHLWPVMVLGE
jgi:hypothetical protein